MDFSSFLSDISLTFDYVFSLIANFVYHLGKYQIVVFAMIVVVALPAFASIFSFISNIANDSEGLGNSMLDNYSVTKKKIDKINKQTEFQRRKAEASSKADIFFKNNVSRMSVTIDGFKFYQDGFENKNWGNRRRKTTTTRLFEKDGQIFTKTNTSITDSKDYTRESDLKPE